MEIDFAEFKTDLDKLREWLGKQPHLPQNIDETLLWRFLHTSNYSLEKTKHLIDLFYTIRSQAPEIFANRDPIKTNIQDVFNVVDLVPLPKPTAANCKILLYRLADLDSDKYNFTDTIKAFFLMADTRMVTEKLSHSGEIPIFDMEGYSLRHLTKVTLPILKKYMLYTQEAHPIRLRQIHMINTPSFLDRCLALIRPFMKSEVAQMIHFHSCNSETLYEYIPKDLLPEEYGGKAGKIADIKREWVEKMNSQRDYFLDEKRWRVDEGKRPEQNGKQHFGMEGSFRSLSID